MIQYILIKEQSIKKAYEPRSNSVKLDGKGPRSDLTQQRRNYDFDIGEKKFEPGNSTKILNTKYFIIYQYSEDRNVRIKTSRILSQNTIYDRESLYNEMLQLKKSSNQLKEENQWFKGKLQYYEQEIIRKEKFINDLLSETTELQKANNKV